VDALSISLGVVLMHPGEDKIDHAIYFASIKLSYFERNFTTIKSEGLEMLYSLQALDGSICLWFLIF
jgi:hypothetical protein